MKFFCCLSRLWYFFIGKHTCSFRLGEDALHAHCIFYEHNFYGKGSFLGVNFSGEIVMVIVRGKS